MENPDVIFDDDTYHKVILYMKSILNKIISFLVFPFQNTHWIKFFSEYLPFGDDARLFYFSLYGERCGEYQLDEKFLNKPLLNDLQKAYPGVTYLNHFLNSACMSDISIADNQQMQFFIMLKSKLFIEYDSTRYYRIYYSLDKNDKDLDRVIEIFRKHQKTDWPRTLRHIYLN
jgi:hypothetical protein